MQIFQPDGTLLLDVEVDDNSFRYRHIMESNNLTLYFSLAQHVEIPLGAYCEFDGDTYTLLTPEQIKKNHNRHFDYTVTFESPQAKTKIFKFRNTVDGRLKFPYTAQPREHLQMLVANMNRHDTGWTVGECIDGVEHLISYDHDYCWDALGKMAQEFETEFEIIGKQVSLHKVEYFKNRPLPLSYGKGNGFRSGVGRSNYNDKPPTDILYVQGGSQNIDLSSYGSTELHLPISQAISFDGEHFEDETGYDATDARRYATDANGLYVYRTDRTPTSHAEESLDASSYYPKRVGTVSNVIVRDASRNFYDICDNTIPATLDYDACQIAGKTMTIVFQSGMLAGREFEIQHYYHNVSGGLERRRFEIVPEEVDGVMMPNATYMPRVGDKYVVFGCMLPSAYICDNATHSGGEWDMFRAAVRYLYDCEEQCFTFSGELDGLWARSDWVNIGGRIIPGAYILFSDPHFQPQGLKIRIVGIKEYVNTPHSPTIELSNETISVGFGTTINTVQSQSVVIEENQQSAQQYARRVSRATQETISDVRNSILNDLASSNANLAGFIFQNGSLNGVNGNATFANGRVVFNANGTVRISGSHFSVDQQGNVTLNNIVANNGTFNGIINASGGLRLNVQTINTETGTINTETVFVLATYNRQSGSTVLQKLTLPASPNRGQLLIVKNNSSEHGTVYVQLDGGTHNIFPGQASHGDSFDYINGGRYLSITAGRTKQLIYNGSQWHVVAQFD